MPPQPAMPPRPRILITHPWMGQGGSEATAAWTVMALQDLAEVTFVTASRLEWETINAVHQTAIDPAGITLRRAPRLPSVRSGTQLVALQQGLFTRYCRSLARHFDACISTYNFLDFGRAGIQLLADFSWDDALQRLVNPSVIPHLKAHGTLLRRAYLAGGRLLRGDGGAVPEGRGDLVLANSQWTADTMGRVSGIPVDGVLYPPVVGGAEETLAAPLEEHRFLILGRISPEKRVLEMLRILHEVRRRGHPVRVTLAGALDHETGYGREVFDLIQKWNDWVEWSGFLSGAAKQTLLARRGWALHGATGEAFGIAVAELGQAGCLTFVPAAGGAAEILDLPELQYRSDKEAVERIVAALEDPVRAQRLRGEMMARASRFSSGRFVREIRGWVEKFLGSPLAESRRLPAGEWLPR